MTYGVAVEQIETTVERLEAIKIQFPTSSLVHLLTKDGEPLAVFFTEDEMVRADVLRALNTEEEDPLKDWGLRDADGEVMKPNVEDNKQELLGKLIVAGVTSVVASYSGGGDEGYVEGVTFVPELPREASADLTQEVDNFVSRCTDEMGLDWCNNEGGGGEMTIDVATGAVRFNHYQNVEDSVSLPFEV